MNLSNKLPSQIKFPNFPPLSSPFQKHFQEHSQKKIEKGQPQQIKDTINANTYSQKTQPTSFINFHHNIPLAEFQNFREMCNILMNDLQNNEYLSKYKHHNTLHQIMLFLRKHQILAETKQNNIQNSLSDRKFIINSNTKQFRVSCDVIKKLQTILLCDGPILNIGYSATLKKFNYSIRDFLAIIGILIKLDICKIRYFF